MRRFIFSCSLIGLLSTGVISADGPAHRVPEQAIVAGEKYSSDLLEAGNRLQALNAEAQSEASRRMAVAQAEYDTIVRQLKDDYLALLTKMHKEELARNRKEAAAQLQARIDVLAQGLPRTKIQELWQASYEAEQQQDYTGAVQAIHDAVSAGGKPKSTFTHLRLGWLHYLNKDYDQAIAAYRVAARNAPRAISPQQGLMNCFVALQRPSEAIAAGKRILAHNPGDRAANTTLGKLYFESDDYASAATYYGSLVSLYPEDLEMWSNLAWCWARQGKTETAKTVFLDILAVDPNQLSALTGYAEVIGKGDSVTQTSQRK